MNAIAPQQHVAIDIAEQHGDETAIRDMLRAFRRRHVEPVWEQLNQVDTARFTALWRGLADTGLTACSLPESDGGVTLDARALGAALTELGAAAPALGAALVSHLTAQALLVEAGNGVWPAAVDFPADASYALLASPLDPAPATGFRITFADGGARLSGIQRVMLPSTGWLVLPARGPERLHLCVLRADAPAMSLRATPSSHGLCLLSFGELQLHDATIPAAQVFDWPTSGLAANTADGLLTALIAGITDELALRAIDYARQRKQAGKMISEHHAVQQLVGPIELARRPLRALAIATLAQPRAGDGSASAFAVQIARRAGIDAIQVFGGYGYMEDCRVERYLRDANTLETFWVHAAQRERDMTAATSTTGTTGTAAAAANETQIPERYLLRDADTFPVLALLRRANPALYRQCIDIQQRTRAYCDRHLRPNVGRWDQVVGRDHDFVPWTAIDASLDSRFLSLSVPALFGGGNLGPVPLGIWSEELAAADAGMFVVYGAHSLAWALIMSSLDLRMMQRIGSEIAAGEREGKPVILALAHTEVGGGSDVEDVDDINRATLGSRWVKVPGGYRVRARKVFCSNGSIAKYIVLTAYGDLTKPLETMRNFVISAGTPGLTIGRPEHKLGQRLCVANEIACDDVFVSDADTVDSGGSAGRSLDATLTLTRGPVGAMSAGIIRGALERVLDYLAERPALAGEQWVRMTLADMIGSLHAARALYLDAALASDEWGFSQLMRMMPMHVPKLVTRSGALRAATGNVWLTQRLRDDFTARVPLAQLQRCVALSSIAKFTASDLAVTCCMKAMEILGEDANDPRHGVEKCLRDAKLAQIFEGTNQINRLHVTRGLLG